MQTQQTFLFKVSKTIRSIYIQIKRFIFSILYGFNSKKYWDALFRSTWDSHGRLQTALFASGFSLIKYDFEIGTLIDYGCGCGDSLPVLRMRFPNAEIYYSDLSDYAMKIAQQNYPSLGTPIALPVDRKFDLVYCSNVLEHIPDTNSFVNEILKMSNKYVVFQAPYNEYHPDGSVITPDKRLDHHVHTITTSFLDEFSTSVSWTVVCSEVPCAWEFGEQIYFIGEIKG